MKVEVLVYIYLAVCIAMIAFNIGTVVAGRRRERVNERRRRFYDAGIDEELDHLKKGRGISTAHAGRLKRMLRKPENMLVFREALRDRYDAAPEDTKAYLIGMYDTLETVVPRYMTKRDYIKYAFILAVIKELIIISGETHDKTCNELIRAVSVRNTYCRENALNAIYASGKEDLVLKALHILDGSGIEHSKKLLADGLMRFRGDKNSLNALLWEHLESFGTRMQEVILNYTRFSSNAHRDDFFSIMTDPERDKELRLSSIRYFGRYPDEEAYPVLISMAQDLDNPNWEYPAIACTALASYPEELTVETLKKALFVPDWYVRYNAAESLGKLGVDHHDIMEVIHGDDRYAREILQFMLDVRSNEKKGVKA